MTAAQLSRRIDDAAYRVRSLLGAITETEHREPADLRWMAMLANLASYNASKAWHHANTLEAMKP